MAQYPPLALFNGLVVIPEPLLVILFRTLKALKHVARLDPHYFMSLDTIVGDAGGQVSWCGHIWNFSGTTASKVGTLSHFLPSFLLVA